MLFSAWTLFLLLVAVCCSSAYSVSAPIVLFDESHGQQFLIGKNGPLDLSELAAFYQANDISVISRSDALTRELLASIDLYTLSSSIAEPDG